MNICENLRKLLNNSKIKPYKMAKEIGIGRGNFYDILSGKNSNPTIKVLKQIADYLGVKVDDLL